MEGGVMREAFDGMLAALKAIRFNLLNAGYEPASIMIEGIDAAIAKAEAVPILEGWVKPLAWRIDQIPPSGECNASSGVGLYSISLATPFVLRLRDSLEIGKFSSLDRAKAAAQADFNHRILSALASPAQGEREGWRDISSTAPTDGSEFMVWFAADLAEAGHGYGYWCEAAFGYPAQFHFYAFGIDERDDRIPTHWMPLPPAPGDSHDEEPAINGARACIEAYLAETTKAKRAKARRLAKWVMDGQNG